MTTHSQLVLFLRSGSYRESAELHGSADFIVRGDTVIWWPVTEPYPYRYHYFGEDLEKADLRDGDRWIVTDNRPELVQNVVKTEHGTIRPGEYIVHPFHGVGILERLESRQTAEGLKQFISLEYAGNDRLLVPVEKQAELMPYIGSRHPRLTRLYSKSWQKSKERVQRDLIGIARELLKMFAERVQTKRDPYPEANDWQKLLESQVSFDLTEDQERAWTEIRADFKNTRPMDRLICGDVGFGKTELALRAAAEVIASGKQVALIAPTTVLSEQHYALLLKRFADLPVTVEHISRLTAGREKEVLAGLTEGRIDLVIGTHRLLSKDIHFKDLGMLILDEEQKFGVSQKERLKDVRPHLDVLSLSATPIPRTLSMSLSGLRSLSILRTPPAGRKPVQTEITDFTEETLRKAVVAETDRGGQVYVVHNRVQSLVAVEQRLCESLHKGGSKTVLYSEGARTSTKNPGEIVVGHAHGQLHEKVLAQTMADFMSGEIDVLVASTIVEYGLDSPTANTLIVLHSEWFGLSDLYQLRGRVGRRKEQAYAYFLLGGVERQPNLDDGERMRLSDTARKRLNALKEADELGSGWSIALRDLEIRGGGNILGHEQHGNMETIGLLLYAQLLQEEIGRQAKKLKIQLF